MFVAVLGLALTGLTVRVAGLTLTVCWFPSDQVRFQGPIPVSTAWITVEPPLQLVALPLTTAVGRGLTVTTALPVRSPGLAVQCASVKAVTLYVMFVAVLGLALTGLTVRVAGLTLAA